MASARVHRRELVRQPPRRHLTDAAPQWAPPPGRRPTSTSCARPATAPETATSPVAPWGPAMAYGRDPLRPRAGDQFLLEQGMTLFVVRTSTGGRALVESGWPWRRTAPGSLSVRTAGGRDRLRRPSPGPWGFTKGRRGEGCAGRGRRRRPPAAGARPPRPRGHRLPGLP